MVDYHCSICKQKYSSVKEAEECEKKGIVGPYIESGVLFSHKESERGFLVFYKELNSEGHDRAYNFEGIIVDKSFIWSIHPSFGLSNSKLESWLKNYNVATDEQVNILNKRIEDKVMGTSIIKIGMERAGIEKLHNNFKLDSKN